MTLNYEQLMKTNLKGYTFVERSTGLNMTSRNGGSSDYYVVLEDNNGYCVIADFYKRDNTIVRPKQNVARSISTNPLMDLTEDKKSYVNKIESV